MENSQIYMPTEDDRQMLIRYARYKLGITYHDAEDLYQDAIIAYWIRMTKSEYQLLEKPISYLQSVLKFKFIDILRARKGIVVLKHLDDMERACINEIDDYFNNYIQVEEINTTLKNFFKTLKPDNRLVFELYFNGYNKLEISQVTRFSISKVRRIIREGKEIELLSGLYKAVLSR